MREVSVGQFKKSLYAKIGSLTTRSISHVRRSMGQAQASVRRTFNAFLYNFRKRAFVYALVIVPVGSLGSSSALLEQHNPGFLAHEIAHETLATVTDAATKRSTNHISPISHSDASIGVAEEVIFVFENETQLVDDDAIRITITPRTAANIQWNEEYNEVQITPDVTWEPDTLYSFALASESGSPARFYHFHTEKLPQISGNTIKGEEEKFIVEKGSVFDVIFDRDISQYDFRAIARGAGVDGIHWVTEVLADERAVRVTLQQAIEKRTELNFITYAKHKKQSDEDYFPIGNLAFVGVPQQPSEWPEAITERAQLAVQKTLPKVTDGKYIDINLAARVTTLFEDGIAVRSIINSPGAEETPTITGEFVVENKYEKPLSNMFGVYLPHWIAFTPDGLYGIHGLVEWPADHPDFPDTPEGGKESIDSIDSAVSAGCVRHDDQSSAEIYEWAEVGTPVIIY